MPVAPVAPRREPGKASSSMNGRERVLAHLAGKEVDRLPLMPITMQLASDLWECAMGLRDRLPRSRGRPIRTAEAYGFDSPGTNQMSIPGARPPIAGRAWNTSTTNPPRSSRTPRYWRTAWIWCN